MMYNSITLILAPYHCGRRNIGPGAGPHYVMQAGLQSELSGFGIPIDIADVQPVDEFDGEIAQMFEISRRISNLVSQARSKKAFPVILAGNCSYSVGVASGLSAAGLPGADMGCVWFDAHDDIHTPDTISSGYGDSMALSLLAGSCFKRMLQSVPGYEPLSFKNFIHVGMRDVTDEERELIRLAGLDVIWGDTENKVDFCKELSGKFKKRDLGSAMIHVDLDCLDSSVGMANKLATPGGLLADDLVGCLQQVASHTRPQSLTFASFDPSFEGAQNIAATAIQGAKALLAEVLTPQNES